MGLKTEALTDQEFVYRKSLTTIKAKSLTLDRIKGHSLAFNQIVQNGNFANGTAGWGTVLLSISAANNVITGTKTATPGTTLNSAIQQNLNTISGHKYYCSAYLKSNNTATQCNIFLRKTLNQNISDFEVYSDFTHISAVFTANDSYTSFRIGCRNQNDNTQDVNMSAKQVMLVDLTLMFGAGNEPSTVEEFEALFPQLYYDYNVGTTISNNADSVETVGLNQWDEEWGNYAWSPQGVRQNNNSVIGTPEPIRVFPDFDYYIRLGSVPRIILGGFAIDGSFRQLTTNFRGGVVHIPADIMAIVFNTYAVDNITTYNHDICINISDASKNGTYEPYKKSTLPLGLNSFRVKDSQGNIITITGGLKSAGDAYDEIVGNKYIKRIGEVDLGTLTWVKIPNYQNVFRSQNIATKRAVSGDGTSNIICSKYSTIDRSGHSVLTNFSGSICEVNTSNPNTRVALADNDYINYTEQQVKADLSGVMLYYELATPEVYELVEPIVPTVKAGTTEARISPNADGLSAPFCADMTYSVDTNLASIAELQRITNSKAKCLIVGTESSCYEVNNGLITIANSNTFNEMVQAYQQGDIVRIWISDDNTNTHLVTVYDCYKNGVKDYMIIRYYDTHSTIFDDVLVVDEAL